MLGLVAYVLFMGVAIGTALGLYYVLKTVKLI
jgi:Cytochrome B6-F complex subunit VI (PetL)